MVAERAKVAVQVLNRFHIMQKVSKTIHEVGAAEVKELKANGKEPVLKNSRWLLLKQPEGLIEEQEPKLAEMVKLSLRTVRAYPLKEDFQQLWGSRSPTDAEDSQPLVSACDAANGIKSK